jgi:hypothetical protein
MDVFTCIELPVAKMRALPHYIQDIDDHIYNFVSKFADTLVNTDTTISAREAKRLLEVELEAYEPRWGDEREPQDMLRLYFLEIVAREVFPMHFANALRALYDLPAQE